LGNSGVNVKMRPPDAAAYTSAAEGGSILEILDARFDIPSTACFKRRSSGGVFVLGTHQLREFDGGLAPPA